MASFIEVSGLTYSGQEAQNIFSHDIYQLDLRQYGIQLMDGVKGKTKLYSGEIGDMFQPYTCAFSAAGEVSLSEQYITPAAIKINLEECYDKFWNTFLVEQTSITLNGGIPQTFEEWFFGKLRQKMTDEYQEIFWKGDTGYTGTSKQYLKVIDGIEAQLEANSGATIEGTAFTVDNILAQVEATIQAGLAKAAELDVPTDQYKVFMNYADVQLLKMALGKICCPNNQSIFSNYAQGPDGGVYIYGYPVISTKQSRNGIIFGPANNLVLGFDTYDSHVEYKLIDMRNTTGDNEFRIIAISNIAAGIVFPELFKYRRPE